MKTDWDWIPSDIINQICEAADYAMRWDSCFFDARFNRTNVTDALSGGEGAWCEAAREAARILDVLP